MKSLDGARMPPFALRLLLLGLFAVLGADGLVSDAQSLPISTYCVTAGQCAALCRSFVEKGRTAEDFIDLASYELGAPDIVSLPPRDGAPPPPIDPANVYSETRANNFSPVVADALARVYAPNLQTGQVDVIDPATFTVIDHFAAGQSPQHIVPSWDLQTLWVTGDESLPRARGSLVPIDPKTGKPGTPVPVDDAYNMYFTPDGRSAIVVAEARRRLEFRDPHTMLLQGYINAPQCAGINHADFSSDGAYAIFTCEFNNSLVKIDIDRHELVATLQLTPGHMPQDIRVAPDGSAFFVADMMGDGVVVIDGGRMKEIGFIATGVGTHGLYPSRDGTRLYVSNRGTHNLAGVKKGAGSISVLDFKTREVIANWPIPNGGSPDMGNVSADGKTLWLSARYDSAVYAIDTSSGEVKTIPVGGMPHGLTVWPQPGRYSLGHTGNMR
ncbi:MAG TPA: YncE family protein [Roseiarcus sp.]|jgi:DNA-binding beta-propeller fold protein YncE|nr:YncE family protein [Roseiarcus sp.]